MSWVTGDPAAWQLGALPAVLAERCTDDRLPTVRVAQRIADRADRIGPEVADALCATVYAVRDRRDVSLLATATCLFVAVVVLGDAEDYLALAAFIDALGSRRAGTALARAGSRLDDSPALPLTFRLMYAMLRRSKIRATLRAAAAADPERADAVAERIYETAFWAFMHGVDLTAPGTPLRTVEEARELFGTDDIRLWRGQAALIAANPWGPYPIELERMLREAGLTVPADRAADCAELYRRRTEKHERMEIARFIRQAVESSGMLQRDFAKLIGTSASRLSTYMSGGVTPSAAMMLRIARVSRDLESPKRGEAGTRDKKDRDGEEA